MKGVLWLLTILALDLSEANPISAASTTTTKAKSILPSSICSLVVPSSVSSSLHCAQYGVLKAKVISPITTFTTDATGLLACSSTCYGNNKCISLGFQAATQNCTLYGVTLNDMSINVAATGNTVYYNKNCFQQSCTILSTSSTSTSTATLTKKRSSLAVTSKTTTTSTSSTAKSTSLSHVSSASTVSSKTPVTKSSTKTSSKASSSSKSATSTTTSIPPTSLGSTSATSSMIASTTPAATASTSTASTSTTSISTSTASTSTASTSTSTASTSTASTSTASTSTASTSTTDPSSSAQTSTTSITSPDPHCSSICGACVANGTLFKLKATSLGPGSTTDDQGIVGDYVDGYEFLNTFDQVGYDEASIGKTGSLVRDGYYYLDDECHLMTDSGQQPDEEAEIYNYYNPKFGFGDSEEVTSLDWEVTCYIEPATLAVNCTAVQAGEVKFYSCDGVLEMDASECPSGEQVLLTAVFGNTNPISSATTATSTASGSTSIVTTSTIPVSTSSYVSSTSTASNIHATLSTILSTSSTISSTSITISSTSLTSLVTSSPTTTPSSTNSVPTTSSTYKCGASLPSSTFVIEVSTMVSLGASGIDYSYVDMEDSYYYQSDEGYQDNAVVDHETGSSGGYDDSTGVTTKSKISFGLFSFDENCHLLTVGGNGATLMAYVNNTNNDAIDYKPIGKVDVSKAPTCQVDESWEFTCVGAAPKDTRFSLCDEAWSFGAEVGDGCAEVLMGIYFLPS